MIDRAFGGYLLCTRELGHDGTHQPNNRANVAHAATSWFRLDQWHERDRLQRIEREKRERERRRF